jgi:hypothetical protein
MLTILAAAAMMNQWPEKEWAFKPVELGATSPLKDAGVLVLRTEAELRDYMLKRGSPRRPLPKIDWKMNQVVAIHVGSSPTAGYGVELKHLWKRPGGAEAEVVITKPAPDMIVAQVITYPFAMVRTERFPGKVDLKIVEPQ